MNKPLAAAIVTTLVAAPAAWRGLGADIAANGPAVRPGLMSLDLDGAQVTMQIDRGAVRSGDSVSAILVASAETPHAVTVDLETLEDMGMGAERVENPPLRIDRRSVTLQARPGGGAPVVATVKLGKKHAKPGFVSWYDVYLLKHRAKAPDSRYGEESGVHAGVVEWSGNTIAMTIEPPAVLPLEGAFTVAVRIKNTTKQPITYVNLDVGGGIRDYNEMGGGLMLEDDAYEIAEIDEELPPINDDTPFAPGAERVMKYTVTPKHEGIKHFNIVAHVRTYGGSGATTAMGGAMDIATADRPELTVEPAIAVTASR